MKPQEIYDNAFVYYTETQEFKKILVDNYTPKSDKLDWLAAGVFIDTHLRSLLSLLDRGTSDLPTSREEAKFLIKTIVLLSISGSQTKVMASLIGKMLANDASEEKRVEYYQQFIKELHELGEYIILEDALNWCIKEEEYELAEIVNAYIHEEDSFNKEEGNMSDMQGEEG